MQQAGVGHKAALAATSAAARDRSTLSAPPLAQKSTWSATSSYERTMSSAARNSELNINWICPRAVASSAEALIVGVNN